ncbi:hypothetical protein RhiXN_05287 [Rhizoctonia solani]|uniref:Uncharacterized protein n=1 Tax=Rhizoctonia solani TaxID=456999 RepID=A0A8H8NQ64_9AGAM|nr:uncharacterized protein RhiXN_05287 [Rhizoctonia solani]QRW17285.1 hypothetical protein RhiXN_05287 [Rhizoctonia solani]
MSTAYLSSPISPVTSQLGRLALLPKSTDDRNSNYQSISGLDEARTNGESWDSWGDRDVLKTVQSMIDYLAWHSKPNHGRSTEIEHRAPVAKGADVTKPFQLRAPQSKQRRSSNDRRYVHPPASRKKYFVVFPCIYSIDQDRIICRLDENFQQHPVISRPMQIKTILSLQGMEYCLDESGDLWYKIDRDWIKETFYTEINCALMETIFHVFLGVHGFPLLRATVLSETLLVDQAAQRLAPDPMSYMFYLNLVKIRTKQRSITGSKS